MSSIPASAPQTTGKRPPPRKERPAGLAIDRRSWEYRLLAKTRAELNALVGPSPSPMVAALVDRASWLTVHVAIMDGTFRAGGKMNDSDAREYASLSNLLVRTLGRLGREKPTKGPQPTLKDFLAARAQSVTPL